MSAGVPGGDPRRSLVELEVLYETGSRCEEIDPGDPDTLAEARQVIARLATPGPWTKRTSRAPATTAEDARCCVTARRARPG